MAHKTPRFTQLADGRWITRWGGKRHYFGRDHSQAVKQYAKSLEDWAAWNDRKTRAIHSASSKRILVKDLARQFLDTKYADGGVDLERYYSKSLRKFLNVYAKAYADDIKVSHLHQFKQALQQMEYKRGKKGEYRKFKPKTINHEIIAIRSMLAWGMSLDYIPTVNLAGCKTVPLGPPPDKTFPYKKVKQAITDTDSPVKPWLAVNYLTMARPIEMIRIVLDQGTWVDEHVYRLDIHKNFRRTSMPRHIVFSGEALKWLKLCQPVWSRLDSYSQAVRKVFSLGGPHRLRHSAASHLLAKGVTRAEVDLLLGHLPSRVSLTYAPITWHTLVDTVARLELGCLDRIEK